ncbi:MAG: undecaprenyl-diphosphate phosphatase [Rikenellaceae bacterium]|nr:undecaprenyl-diphosphate phosphatase [Rikenellaceae bacterium]
MNWYEGLLLGLVQGLTEFLPVSSSGHLRIGRELLGIEAGGDIVFEVAVHAATVLSTIVVFRRQIWNILCSLFAKDGLFRNLKSPGTFNDGTDYVLKILLSMVPVFIVGMFFKDAVTALFDSIYVVAGALLLTAALLLLSDFSGKFLRNRTGSEARNGISWWQALIVGIGQAIAVIPGLSRSGTTIATGLLCGVKRDVVAQFSFLMVLVPILGEAFLDIVGGDFAASTTGVAPLIAGFCSAFLSGLVACRAMVALVKRTRLGWFALYCAVLATAIFIFA